MSAGGGTDGLLDRLDVFESGDAGADGADDGAAALRALLGAKPDAPKRAKSIEGVRASLDALLGGEENVPPELLGKAALEALDADYQCEGAGADGELPWAGGACVMKALGASEPLSLAELERQVDVAAEAERAAERQLEQQRHDREMLVALLQGVVEGEEEEGKRLEESDPAAARRRRKHERRRARAAELLERCRAELPPNDLSADELSAAAAWLYEGEERPGVQGGALEQLVGDSAADQLLASIDADLPDTAGAWGDAGAMGALLAADEEPLEEGVTPDMVRRMLEEEEPGSGGGPAGRGWRRVVGDSDEMWSDGQPPAQVPSAYSDSLQVLGVLPLPGDGSGGKLSADAFAFDKTAAAEGDALRSLGIAEPDKPEPKLPRGARNLNDLLGGESDLLKLLVARKCTEHDHNNQ
eukprot:COSAG06_NODE_9454_length_1897_cov_1.791991_1_plen_414_part_00